MCEKWEIQAKKKDLALWKTIATTKNLSLKDDFYKTACRKYKHVRLLEKDTRGIIVSRLKGVK
jgi:hypothetical protein